MPALPAIDSDLKQLAVRLTAVARKKRLSAKELSALAEIRNRIAEVLQALKECEACGAVVTNIAAVEIKGVRARVCTECGIRALRSNQLKPRKHGAGIAPRKKKGVEHKAKSGPQNPVMPGTQTTLEIPIAAEKESAGQNDTIETLVRETGQKAAVIRRIRKIAQDIAMPMNFEGTYNFTRAEARKENIKADDDQIRTMLQRFADASEIRVKMGAGA